MEEMQMLKKVIVIVLAMSILLCLAACGNETAPVETDGNTTEESATESSEAAPISEPEISEPKETKETVPDSSSEEKRLSELIAETNPTNKYEELAAACEICQEQFDLAVASVEKAGLSEDSTLSGLIADWSQQLGDLRDYLKGYEGASEEELTALDEDEEFMYYADNFLPVLSRMYNMTSAIAEDPALWLERYTAVPESETEQLECDGSWPEGYFFSDRVPALERVDDFLTSMSGGVYGYEGGTEYALLVNEFGEDQALAYIDRLMEMGFREETKTDAMGTFLWFGRMDDSEGHISAAIMYNGSAAGTPQDPAFMVQFYDYDIIGVMLDIGQIY